MARKVFIPQLPTRWDVATNQRIPSIDTNPAAQWGELVIMFPPDTPKESAITRLRAMDSLPIAAGDYILAAGDVVLLTLVILGAMRRNGYATLLRWDSETKTYRTEEVHP